MLNRWKSDQRKNLLFAAQFFDLQPRVYTVYGPLKAVVIGFRRISGRDDFSRHTNPEGGQVYRFKREPIIELKKTNKIKMGYLKNHEDQDF